MWDRHPVSLSLLHMLPAIAGLRGLSLPSLLEGAGIASDTPDLWTSHSVARSQVCSLLSNLARQSGEATIGFDLAASADPSQLGVSGQALLTAATLRHALMAQARQMPSLQGGVMIEVEAIEGRRYACWRHRLLDSDGEHARILNEGIAGFTVKALRAISGRPDLDLHVTLPHRRQTLLRHYDEQLRAPVSFGGTRDLVITFDQSLLDAPNALANHLAGVPPPVAGLPPEAQALGDAELIAVLRLTFARSALLGRLSLREACQTLGLPPRSLQRRLARLGTTFEILAAEWRHARARRYLTDSSLSVGEVAHALGYAHAGHFIRAFRRWEGLTPSSYRLGASAD